MELELLEIQRRAKAGWYNEGHDLGTPFFPDLHSSDQSDIEVGSREIRFIPPFVGLKLLGCYFRRAATLNLNCEALLRP